MKEYGSQAFFTPMDQNPLGYEAHHQLTESMQVTQYHCHDYYEFYLHVRGGELMGVDNKLYALKPNQLFILPPFFMHGLSCTGEMRNYERAYLNLSPEVLGALGCGQIDLVQFFRSHASHGRFTYQLSSGDAESYVSLLSQISSSYSKDMDPMDRFRDYSLMMNAINLIIRVLGGNAPEESQPVSNSIIQDVLTYINNHFTEQLSVADLASLFSVSPSYLAHEFTRFTHRSVYNYILYRRVTLSRQQMLGDASLNDIAYQCGFCDYSNFLRTFTKMAGMSPSEYRRQLQRFHNREL